MGMQMYEQGALRHRSAASQLLLLLLLLHLWHAAAAVQALATPGRPWIGGSTTRSGWSAPRRARSR